MISSGRRSGAIFVDRDGVIGENRPDYVKSWSEFAFIPGAIEAMASMSRVGSPVVIVTNQSAVGRGLLSRRQLDMIHERMLDSLAASGAKVHAIMVCPHHPDDACRCRKPEPGMLEDAAERFKLDLALSYLIGDHSTDIEAGARAGCRTVLVRTGRGADLADRAAGWRYPPDFIADDLVDAALWIVADKAMASDGARMMEREVRR